ncbi:MAG: hypothetical protein ABWJ98_03605 [Hydrogenothermaceae bacterium]
MSVKDAKIRINQISRDFIELIEREENYEKRIKLFESFYKTLNLIQDIYNPAKNYKKFKL